MKKQVLISLTLLGTVMVLFALMGNVQATSTVLTKEHRPASAFTDPTGIYDGYYLGQTVTWHVHLNVTTSTGGPWLSISNLTLTDDIPNVHSGGPLYMTYVTGSQNSSSATGPAAFTDFGNGTLLWNFGKGPFTTGVLAPPPFSSATEFYTASVTFNATILGTVPNSTYLVNAGLSSYTETYSQSHSAPGTSDTIWLYIPPKTVPEVPLGPLTAVGSIVAAFGVFYLLKKNRLHIPKQ